MNYQKKYLTWDNIDHLIKRIVTQLMLDDVDIDTIVPIVKGGFIPSMLIGKNFNIDKYSCLHIRRSNTNLSNCDFHSPELIGLTGKDYLKDANILIVEDIVYSGETLKFAIEELKKCGVKNIYVASLYNFYLGDDFGKIYQGNKNSKEVDWIVFPWDYENNYAKEV